MNYGNISVNTRNAQEINNKLKEYTQQLSSMNSILQNTINKVNGSWESTGQDKISYIDEIQKQKNNLDILVTGLLELTKQIDIHIEQLEETQRHGMR